MSTIALMVVSCDKYQDTWKPFFAALDKFWPNCEMKKYLVTNEIKNVPYDIEVISTGPEKSWSAKVRTALANIQEECIFLLLDDYFLDGQVDNKVLQELLCKMDQERIDYVSFEVAPTDFRDGNIGRVSNKNVYGKVLQPAFWKKEYLMKCLFDDHFSAWEFESRQKNKSALKIKGNDYCTTKRMLFWQNGVLQGKWYPDAVLRMNAVGITIDTTQRGMLAKHKVINLKIKRFLIKLLPRRFALPARRLLQKFGMKFITD